MMHRVRLFKLTSLKTTIYEFKLFQYTQNSPFIIE